tara:strand:- start:739 stop:936 length:198 start_codon:yes stop_codon:yes gene_type:complete
MARKKIENLPDFIKDENSGAVINTNSNAIRARRAQMNLASQQAEKILVLEEELAELKKAIKKLSK